MLLLNSWVFLHIRHMRGDGLRLVFTRNCKPGMRIAREIYNEQGLVLLHENVELNMGLIKKLQKHGIDYVYIYDPRTEDIELQEMLHPKTRSRALQQIKMIFTRMMDQFQKKRTSTAFFDKELKQIIHMVTEDITRHDQAMIMLSDIRAANDHLFNHSLNVGLFSIIMGLAMGYDSEELMVIGLGGMLHDIGKMQISPALLNKPGNLTRDEMQVMKRHAELGFKMLKDIPNIPLITAHCAFQHHERLNGSGYPRGIQGEEIHEYAQWIGIIDSYDAMTNHRPYRQAMLPHQAMEILYSGCGTDFEKKKLELFRDKVAVYPIGCTVELNTGERGVVVDLNIGSLHRPIVRVLEEQAGIPLSAPYELDLSKKLNIMITKMIYEV